MTEEQERMKWKRDHFAMIYGISRESWEKRMAESREGQGSDMLRELAKIELQAAVGNQLVGLIKVRFGELALSSPGNLRLARHLLNLRAHDENGYQGDQVGGEDWDALVEESEDSLRLIGYWELLIDAEEYTRVPGAMEGPLVWEAGRKLAIIQMSQVFTELETRLGSYKVSTRIEGNRITEEIVQYDLVGDVMIPREGDQ